MDAAPDDSEERQSGVSEGIGAGRMLHSTFTKRQCMRALSGVLHAWADNGPQLEPTIVMMTTWSSRKRTWTRAACHYWLTGARMSVAGLVYVVECMPVVQAALAILRPR